MQKPISKASYKSRLVLALSISFLVVSAVWSMSKQEPVRHDENKHSRVEEHGEHLHQSAKAGSSFAITLSSDDGVHLVATITANRHIAPHDYSWVLPEGYVLTSGSEVGVVPELRPGDTHKLAISFDGGNQSDRPIVLHVYKVVNAQPIGLLAQYDPPARGGHGFDQGKTTDPHSQDDRGPAKYQPQLLYPGEKFVQ
jgi:hypothetical protein